MNKQDRKKLAAALHEYRRKREAGEDPTKEGDEILTLMSSLPVHRIELKPLKSSNNVKGKENETSKA